MIIPNNHDIISAGGKSDKENQGMAHPLDGKNVLIVGNSYVYYGNTVIGKDNSLVEQKYRENDTGYFYQLCKANGAAVNYVIYY